MKVTIKTEREVRSLFDMRVGQHIRTEREIAGIAQCDMAKKLGISQSAYSRIETGATRCSLWQFAKIADILETSLMSLLGDSLRELRK